MCVCVCVCTCVYLWKTEVLEFSRAGIAGGCELTNINAGNWVQVLWRSSIYLQLLRHLPLHLPQREILVRKEQKSIQRTHQLASVQSLILKVVIIYEFNNDDIFLISSLCWEWTRMLVHIENTTVVPTRIIFPVDHCNIPVGNLDEKLTYILREILKYPPWIQTSSKTFTKSLVGYWFISEANSSIGVCFV